MSAYTHPGILVYHNIIMIEQQHNWLQILGVLHGDTDDA
jgi:hypothetical protein